MKEGREEEEEEDFLFLLNVVQWEGGRRLSRVAPRPPLLLHLEGGGGASIVFWQQLPRPGAKQRLRYGVSQCQPATTATRHRRLEPSLGLTAATPTPALVDIIATSRR